MTPENILKEIFLENPSLLNFISICNKNNIVTAITGSSSLYIHGGFGRKPNDLDIYTSTEDLKHLSEKLKRNTISVERKPISWEELETIEKEPHVLAGLKGTLENNKQYEFSMTELVIQNLRKYSVDEIAINVIPPEEVLLLKLTAPRKSETKDDLKDVKNYIERNTLDKNYMEKRSKEIGIYEIINKEIT